MLEHLRILLILLFLLSSILVGGFLNILVCIAVASIVAIAIAIAIAIIIDIARE